MSNKEQQYYRAHNAWITARENFKRNMNNLGGQLVKGQLNADEPGFERHFNYAYNLYQPTAKRYLEALKEYTHERPELKGRLMYLYMNEASIAQSHNRTDISESYLKSIDQMAVDSAKVAHADWVKNGNAETMSAVFVSIADAQLLNVDGNSEVKNIAREVFDYFQQGKLKRDPKSVTAKSTTNALQEKSQGASSVKGDTEIIPVKPTPKVPTAKRRQGPSLWLRRTIEY